MKGVMTMMVMMGGEVTRVGAATREGVGVWVGGAAATRTTMAAVGILVRV